MAEFFQQVVAGLATGSIFAALALALVLIHRATGVINFAQGAMAMFTTYMRVRTTSLSLAPARSSADLMFSIV